MIKIQLDKFQEKWKELCDKEQKALVLFTSQSDANGNYWCPDCQKIAPLYPQFEAQAKKAKLPFYVFIAGDKPTWKDSEHIFRKNPMIKVFSVPTMGIFDGKKVTRKLQEDEILSKEQRDLLFEKGQL